MASAVPEGTGHATQLRAHGRRTAQIAELELSPVVARPGGAQAASAASASRPLNPPTPTCVGYHNAPARDGGLAAFTEHRLVHVSPKRS